MSKKITVYICRYILMVCRHFDKKQRFCTLKKFEMKNILFCIFYPRSHPHKSINNTQSRKIKLKQFIIHFSHKKNLSPERKSPPQKQSPGNTAPSGSDVVVPLSSDSKPYVVMPPAMVMSPPNLPNPQ